jgi:hypothetical protein
LELNKNIIIMNSHILTSMINKNLRHFLSSRKYCEYGLIGTIQGWNPE